MHKKPVVKTLSLILLGVIIGVVGSPECRADRHASLMKDYEEVNKMYNEQKAELTDLQEKVKQAEPFFDMKKDEQEKIEKQAQQIEEQKAAAELESKSVTLKNGNYVAGSDFDAGIYDIVAISGKGNVSSDNVYQGGINAIMGTVDDGFYNKEYKNVKLPQGTTLRVDRVEIKLIPRG